MVAPSLLDGMLKSTDPCHFTLALYCSICKLTRDSLYCNFEYPQLLRQCREYSSPSISADMEEQGCSDLDGSTNDPSNSPCLESPGAASPSNKRISRPVVSRLQSTASVESSIHSQPALDKFAALRDSIYFSRKNPGFILSADETFVYPAGAAANGGIVEPIEIEDIEEYFLTGWTLFTPDFSRRLKFEEYPVIRLSRETPRKELVARCGWLQDHGRRVVYEVSQYVAAEPF